MCFNVITNNTKIFSRIVNEPNAITNRKRNNITCPCPTMSKYGKKKQSKQIKTTETSRLESILLAIRHTFQSSHQRHEKETLAVHTESSIQTTS